MGDKLGTISKTFLFVARINPTAQRQKARILRWFRAFLLSADKGVKRFQSLAS